MVIAAQSPSTLIDGLEEIDFDDTTAEQLISHANSLLDEAGVAERDEIIQRREESARREARRSRS